MKYWIGDSMKKVAIGSNEHGQRVDRLVGKLIPRAEKGLVYKAIRKKIVTLNGKKTAPDVRVSEGDELKLFFSDETLKELGGTVNNPVEAGKETEDNKAHVNFGENDTVKSGTTDNTANAKGNAGSKNKKGIKGYRFDENIIYEDPDVILVYKPAGILSQGAQKKDTGPRPLRSGGQGSIREEVSLNDLLIDYLERTGKLSGTGETFRPSVCNRLDRNTAGIVVCGCSLKGLRIMSSLIHDRKLEKYYLCAVKGIIKEPGDLKGWLLKDEKTNKVKVYQDFSCLRSEKAVCISERSGCDEHKSEAPVPGALNIETKYRPFASAHDMTLLEVELVTGRPHQIRAHMASVGHPVVGDPKYGDARFNRVAEREYGIRYQALVAWRLRFPDVGGLRDLSQREFRCKAPEFSKKIFEVDL